MGEKRHLKTYNITLAFVPLLPAALFSNNKNNNNNNRSKQHSTAGVTAMPKPHQHEELVNVKNSTIHVVNPVLHSHRNRKKKEPIWLLGGRATVHHPLHLTDTPCLILRHTSRAGLQGHLKPSRSSYLLIDTLIFGNAAVPYCDVTRKPCWTPHDISNSRWMWLVDAGEGECWEKSFVSPFRFLC